MNLNHIESQSMCYLSYNDILFSIIFSNRKLQRCGLDHGLANDVYYGGVICRSRFDCLQRCLDCMWDAWVILTEVEEHG